MPRAKTSLRIPVHSEFFAPVKSRAGTCAPAATYVRSRDLTRLLPLWPCEIATRDHSEDLRLLAKLRRALRSERQRELDGHWAYDLARHAHLLRAYRAEMAAYWWHGVSTSTPKRT
jgi:hypothetical protein